MFYHLNIVKKNHHYGFWGLLFWSWIGLGCGGTGLTGPQYIGDPHRAEGLPTDPMALVALADLLVEQKPATLKNIDRSLAALEQALDQGHSEPLQVLWRLSRSCLCMTELLDKKNQVMAFGQRGVKYAEAALDISVDHVEPHYYKALNMAKMVEITRELSDIKLMLKSAEVAAKINPSYDNAGALSFMGKVYISAPKWPISVGAPDKGVELLERAVSIAPTPMNRLFLGQACFHDDEYSLAKEHLLRALKEGEGKVLGKRWKIEVKEAQKLLERIKDEES